MIKNLRLNPLKNNRFIYELIDDDFSEVFYLYPKMNLLDEIISIYEKRKINPVPSIVVFINLKLSERTSPFFYETKYLVENSVKYINYEKEVIKFTSHLKKENSNERTIN